MCVAVGYIRVSTDTQVKNGEGLNNQKQEIEKYCKANKIKLDKIFADEAMSGADENRQGINDLFAYARENKIDRVVIHKLDRLSRDTMYGLFVRKELKKIGVELLSIKEEGLTGTDPVSELMNTIIFAFATFEKSQITSRMLSGRKEKARGKKQKASGNCPFGYKYQYDGQGKNSIVVKNSDESGTVREIFNLYLNKKHSLQKIANTLNNKGIKTRRGNDWSKQSVKVVLSNDFYTGVVTFGEIKEQGSHEALITKITFGKTQAALKRNSKRANAKRE